MALSPQLIDKLVCPKCGGEMTYRKDDDRLDCHACKLSYKITDDIPVLLMDEADRLE